MNKRLIIVSVLGLLTAAAGSSSRRYRHHSGAGRNSASACARAGLYGTVQSKDVPIYLRGVGTVIAYNNVIARSQITGQLVKIAFQQGQTVHKGDLLAEIDPRPYQAQLDQMTANRDRDQAQLVNAQSNLDRYTKLGVNGWATPQLIETQKAQLGELHAMVKSDEALIEAAQVNLSCQAERADRRRHRHSPDRHRQHHSSD